MPTLLPHWDPVCVQQHTTAAAAADRDGDMVLEDMMLPDFFSALTPEELDRLEAINNRTIPEENEEEEEEEEDTPPSPVEKAVHSKSPPCSKRKRKSSSVNQNLRPRTRLATQLSKGLVPSTAGVKLPKRKRDSSSDDEIETAAAHISSSSSYDNDDDTDWHESSEDDISSSDETSREAACGGASKNGGVGVCQSRGDNNDNYESGDGDICRQRKGSKDYYDGDSSEDQRIKLLTSSVKKSLKLMKVDADSSDDENRSSSTAISDSELEDLMLSALQNADKSHTETANEVWLKMKKKQLRMKIRRRQEGLPRKSKKNRTSRRKRRRPTKLNEVALKFMQQANTLYLDGNMVQCVRKLHEVIKSAPGAPDPFILLGTIFENEYRNPQKGAEFYVLAAQLSDKDGALWKRAGNLFYNLGNVDQAIYCYRRCVRVNQDPNCVDEEACYDLAVCWVMRYEFRKAARLLMMLFNKHLGDDHLGQELAKCFYQLNDFMAAILVLEICVRKALPKSVAEKCGLGIIFCSQDNQTGGGNVSLSSTSTILKTSHHCDSGPPKLTKQKVRQQIETCLIENHNDDVSEDDVSVPLSTPMELDSLRLLCNLYIDTSQFQKCKNVLCVIFKNEDLMECSENIPIEFRVAFAVSLLRTNKDEDSVVKLGFKVRQQLDEAKDMKKYVIKLFAALADAFLYAENPEGALSIYRKIEPFFSSTESASYCVKIAKCYVQLNHLETAAQFLEEMLTHRNQPPILSGQDTSGGGAAAMSTTTTTSTAKSNNNETSSNAVLVPLTAKIRRAEAQMLLFDVLTTLGKQQQHPDDPSNDSRNFSISFLNYQKEDFRIIPLDSTGRLTDSRVRHLSTHSTLFRIPDFIPHAQRHTLVVRLKSLFKSLMDFISNVKCVQDFHIWFTKQVGRSTLPDRQIPKTTAVQHLSPSQLLFFEASDLVTDSELFNAIVAATTQEEYAPSRVSVDLNRETCVKCKSQTCGKVIGKFTTFKSRCWIAEFLLLIADNELDTFRVLLESADRRIEKAQGDLRREESMVDDELAKFNCLTAQPPAGFVPGAHLVSSSNSSKISESNGGNYDGGSSTSNPIVDMRTRGAAKRYRQRAVASGPKHGFFQPVLHHARIKLSLKLCSMEDWLGWDDYYRLLAMGVKLMVREGMSRAASELLETILVNKRLSKTKGFGDYAERRSVFRSRLKHLSLKLGLLSGSSRVVLSSVRLRFISPLLRRLTAATRDFKQENHSSAALQRLKECSNAYEHAMGVFNRLLFFGPLSNHAIRNMTASTEKEILTENRAWITRQLLLRPRDFPLTMLAGHFCSLSGRWSLAVGEYLRAVRLCPINFIANLSLAVSYLGFSMSRAVQDRHRIVIRAFVLLDQAIKLRKKEGERLANSASNFVNRRLATLIASSINEISSESEWSPWTHSFYTLMTKRNTASQFQSEIEQSVEEIAEFVKECHRCYYLAECLYNKARAYHQLALNHFALPLYLNCLRLLTAIEDSEKVMVSQKRNESLRFLRLGLEETPNSLERDLWPFDVQTDTQTLSLLGSTTTKSEESCSLCAAWRDMADPIMGYQSLHLPPCGILVYLNRQFKQPNRHQELRPPPLLECGMCSSDIRHFLYLALASPSAWWSSDVCADLEVYESSTSSWMGLLVPMMNSDKSKTSPSAKQGLSAYMSKRLMANMQHDDEAGSTTFKSIIANDDMQKKADEYTAPLADFLAEFATTLEFKDIEQRAQDELQNFGNGIPHGAFLLGLDLPQLKICAAINLSHIFSASKNAAAAAAIRRKFIVWKV